MKSFFERRRNEGKTSVPGGEKAGSSEKKKAILSFFDMKSIKTKLVMTFALLIIIPVLLVAVVAINTSSSNLVEKAKEILTNSTRQTNNYYEITLKQISSSIINQILYNPQTTEFLNMSDNNADKTSSAQKVLQDMVATYYDLIDGGIIL